MAQPLHVPPKPAESAKLRTRLYELTMARPFKQFFAILVVGRILVRVALERFSVNSATLVVPWNEQEEESKSNYLYFSTALSALCNILFTVEVLNHSI